MYIYIYKYIDTHIYLYIYLLYLCAGIYVHRIIWIHRFVRHITSLRGGAPRLLSDVASAGVQRSMTTSDSTARSTAIESRIFALESERTNPGSNRQQWTHPRITDHHQQNQEYTAFMCFDCVSLCLLSLLKISLTNNTCFVCTCLVTCQIVHRFRRRVESFLARNVYFLKKRGDSVQWCVQSLPPRYARSRTPPARQAVLRRFLLLRCVHFACSQLLPPRRTAAG